MYVDQVILISGSLFDGLDLCTSHTVFWWFTHAFWGSWVVTGPFYFLPKVVRHYQFSTFLSLLELGWFCSFSFTYQDHECFDMYTCFYLWRYLCQLFLVQWICSRWENWVEDLRFKMLWYAWKVQKKKKQRVYYY